MHSADPVIRRTTTHPGAPAIGRATADPAPAAADPAPAAADPPREIAPVNVGALMGDLDAAWLEVRRAVAGYARVNHLFRSVAGGLAEGELPAGPPLITFPATVTGHDVETICLDLRDVPREELEYLLIPMLNGFAVQLGTAAQKFAALMAQLKTRVPMGG